MNEKINSEKTNEAEPTLYGEGYERGLHEGYDYGYDYGFDDGKKEGEAVSRIIHYEQGYIAGVRAAYDAAYKEPVENTFPVLQNKIGCNLMDSEEIVADIFKKIKENREKDYKQGYQKGYLTALANGIYGIAEHWN